MTEKKSETPSPPAADDKSKKPAPPSGSSTAQPAANKAQPTANKAQTTANNPANKPAPASAPPGAVGKKGAPGAPSRKPGSGGVAALLVLVIVLVLVLAAVLWYQMDVSQKATAQLTSQNTDTAKRVQDASDQAQQALQALKQQDQKIAQLTKKLNDSQAELDSLGNAFQLLTDRGSDLVLLNDIDHLVTIAQQQLQLSGNVANAIISLETAQAQLARANRPALASLQQTINGDLDRLRAVATVDIAMLSGRLDELAGLVAQAPLLVPDDASPGAQDADDRDADSTAAPASSDADTGVTPEPSQPQPWWKNALTRSQEWVGHTVSSLRNDLGEFVSVRRVDDAAALLVSPDQASRFRDNLRLRIMTAQLALMMGQSQVWESETDSLLRAIEGRFDTQSSLARKALKIARDIADTSIDTQLPTVTNSVKALEALRESKPGAEPSANGSSAEAEANDEAGTVADDAEAPADASTENDESADENDGSATERSDSPHA